MTGNAGSPGPQGPPGPSTPIGHSATFISRDTGYYQGGSQYSGKVLPLQEQTFTTNPDSYTLNGDGTVTINRTGAYRITTEVQQEAGDSNSFAVQVNGQGASGTQYNTFATEGGGFQRGTITTVMPLNAGDKVSVALISPGPITLRRNPNGTSTSTSTVNMTITQVM
jgi:hypothetical protein